MYVNGSCILCLTSEMIIYRKKSVIIMENNIYNLYINL